MRTAKEGNPLRVQNSELQRWAIGSLACTQVIMSDIGVEEEVIDIESDIADDSNMHAAPRGGAGGDPLDDNGNDDAAVGGRKRGRHFYSCPTSDDYTSESDSNHAGLN